MLADATTAALDALIAEAGGPAWDAAGFARLRGHVGGRLQAKTAEVVAAVARILDAARDVERRLETLSAPAFEPARRDVRAQLARLVHARLRRPHRRRAAGRRRALPAGRRPPARAAARRHRRRPRPHARLHELEAGLPRAARRLAARARAAAGAARGPVDARGAAGQPVRAGARHARAGVGEADPPRTRRGGLNVRLLGREGCAGAAARASPRPPTASAASAGCSPRARAATAAGRPWCRSCCCWSCSPAPRAPAGCCWRARPPPTAARRPSMRFTTAWQRGDYPAMWRTISPERRRDWPLAQFAASYRIAARAGDREVRRACGRARRRSRVGRRCACGCARATSGSCAATIPLRVVERDGEAYMDWSPAWRLPGLREAENVRRTVLARPDAAADHRRRRQPARRRADGGGDRRHPAGGRRARHRPAGALRRAARRPPGRGAALRQADRQARSRSSAGAPCARRSRRGCSASPPRALGDRLGGVAVIRPRTGARARHGAGIAASGPQPPGSTFKIITLSGALQAGIASPSSGYPVQTGATLSGVRAGQREQRVVRRLARRPRSRTRATRCSRRSGAKLGAKRLVRLAEAYGFNEKPRLPARSRARSRATSATTSRSAPRRSARSATSPRPSRWPPSARRSPTAACGCARGSCAASAARRRRVVSRKVAGQVRDMMLGVVRGGTGDGGRAPGRGRGGQDRHRRAAPDRRRPDRPEEHRRLVRRVRARVRPKVAVAVMLVGAGQGGATAAPIAREVLAAAL